MSNEGKTYLTLTEYAAAIGKSPRTVHRWLDQGTLKSDVKLPGVTGAHLFLASRVKNTRSIERSN